MIMILIVVSYNSTTSNTNNNSNDSNKRDDRTTVVVFPLGARGEILELGAEENKSTTCYVEMTADVCNLFVGFVSASSSVSLRDHCGTDVRACNTYRGLLSQR